jgi:hypothetical protein
VLVADCTALPYKACSVDAAVDKGTLDALLLCRGSDATASSSSTGYGEQLAQKMLRETHRVSTAQLHSLQRSLRPPWCSHSCQQPSAVLDLQHLAADIARACFGVRIGHKQVYHPNALFAVTIYDVTGAS